MLPRSPDGLMKPAVRQLLQSRRVAGVSAFSVAKYAIERNAADVNLLFFGDSTGNETTEWIYLLSTWLGGQYQTHSVSYRLWNDVTNLYDAAVAISTGTGARTIRVWNASVAGTVPRLFTGSKYTAAVANLPAVDAVIWSHGLNLASFSPSTLIRGEFLGLMEMVRTTWPGAVHAMVAQDPRTDSTLIETTVSPVIKTICQDRGDTGFIDVCSQFMFAGKPASWYLDTLHPNGTGEAVWANYVQSIWTASKPAPYITNPAWTSSQVTNLITNGNFADWPGATPTGWTNNGALTVAKDVGTVYPGASYSASLTTTGAAGSLGFSVTGAAATNLRSKVVTLAVRQFVPSGATSTTGRIGLFFNGTGSTTVQSIASTDGQGGWRWTIISGIGIPSDVTTIVPFIYADTAASTGAVAYYDRAILVEGYIPRNML